MPSPKLHKTTERMFQLLDYMIKKGMVANMSQGLEYIGINPNNMWKFKNGVIKFTINHINTACEVTGASADYIFGFTETILRKPSKNALEMLQEAVVAVEQRLKEQ